MSSLLTNRFLQFFPDFLFRFRFRNVADEQSQISHAAVRFDQFSRSNGVTVQLER